MTVVTIDCDRYNKLCEQMYTNSDIGNDIDTCDLLNLHGTPQAFFYNARD